MSFKASLRTGAHRKSLLHDGTMWRGVYFKETREAGVRNSSSGCDTWGLKDTPLEGQTAQEQYQVGVNRGLSIVRGKASGFISRILCVVYFHPTSRSIPCAVKKIRQVAADVLTSSMLPSIDFVCPIYELH